MSSSAGNRAMYRDPYVIQLANRFAAYDASQLLAEIDLLGLNRRGSLEVLRDRLIRYMVKQFRPQYRAPWNDSTDLRPNDEMPFTLNALNAEVSYDPITSESFRGNIPVSIGNVGANSQNGVPVTQISTANGNAGAIPQNNVPVTQIPVTSHENWRSRPTDNWRDSSLPTSRNNERSSVTVATSVANTTVTNTFMTSDTDC